MKSKVYVMWLCDKCEDGIEHCKRTKNWAKGHPCIFCNVGKMTKENVTLEVKDK